jgi:hypothetical protein
MITQITRDGLAAGPNMTNGKPYRTKAQKAEARAKARKDDDGTYRSSAPVSYHPTAKKG